MLLERITNVSCFPLLAGLCIIGLVYRLLHNKYGHGINDIPGPTLAAFTDLWRFWIVWQRRPELVHIKLHEKYGKIVRLGPKTVSISDAKASKTIYALNAGFIKSGFYPVQQTIAKGRSLHSLFNTTDEKFHAKLRRAVNNAYAMSSLVQFEPLVDSTTTAFLEQLASRYADREDDSGVCDFGSWLQYYAFDVIGELTYSKRLGFVDRGVDVDSIISNLEWLLNYVSVIGQIPVLDRIFLKNPFILWCSKMSIIETSSPVVKFAKKCMADRGDLGKADIGAKVGPNDVQLRRDFLTRFIEAHIKDPDFINQERVLALTVANMFAGSDTTAISLRAIFYHLLRSPAKLEALMDELGQMEKAGMFAADSYLVKWNDVRDLPYLSAVIKEALRCHPAVGLMLERIVPSQGVRLCGKYLPAGTIVGCTAWSLHRNEEIFGADTHLFLPERWLDASEAEKTDMNNYLFSFGAGSRACIGRNISLLEMYKLVPAILRRFEISLFNPEQEWSLHNAWFVKQSNFRIRLRTRKRQAQTGMFPV